MKLYILRHAHSPPLWEAKVDKDEDRPISEEGRQGLRRVLEHLKKQNPSVALILASPLLRARQTAQEAVSLLGLTGVEIFQPLDGTLPPERLWLALKERLQGVKEALLVGHQPQLGRLIAYLSGSQPELIPGGLVSLELDEKDSTLLWSVNPRDL